MPRIHRLFQRNPHADWWISLIPARGKRYLGHLYDGFSLIISQRQGGGNHRAFLIIGRIDADGTIELEIQDAAGEIVATHVTTRRPMPYKAMT